MNDLATLNRVPKLFRFGGKDYAIHPLSFQEIGQLQAWVDQQFPDPIQVADEAIARGGYSVSQQQFLYRTAMELATKGRRLVGTSEADEKLQSFDGIMEILFHSIAKGDPTFTREDAQKIGRTLTPGDVQAIFAATNMDMVLSDPKAEAGMTTPPGPTTA